MKNYIDNESFYNKMALCIKENKLNDEAWQDILLITDRVLSKYVFKDDEHKQKCKDFALEEVKKYWKEFNPNHPNKPISAFNVISGLLKNGIKRVK